MNGNILAMTTLVYYFPSFTYYGYVVSRRAAEDASRVDNAATRASSLLPRLWS